MWDRNVLIALIDTNGYPYLIHTYLIHVLYSGNYPSIGIVDASRLLCDPMALSFAFARIPWFQGHGTKTVGLSCSQIGTQASLSSRRFAHVLRTKESMLCYNSKF